jgi:hypothetical protein
MSVIVIAARDQVAAQSSKISWLFEDTWIDDKGDADLLLECIVEPVSRLNELTFLVPFYVEDVKDIGYLYKDQSFQYGYPKCWLDIYSRFIIINNSHTTVEINGINAKVSEIKCTMGYRSQNSSEIIVTFVPPILDGEKRIIRIALLCKNIVQKSLMFFREKQIKVFSYGLAPFSGSEIMNVLSERKMQEDSWFLVDKHIISINIWDKSPVVIPANILPTKSYYFNKCEYLPRYCPPLEIMAKRLGKNVKELKNRGSYCSIWEFNNNHPARGQQIDYKYFESTSHKWISDNWLSLLALLISIISIILAVIK